MINSNQQAMKDLLINIEMELKNMTCWERMPPRQAFSSQLPFSCDKLMPTQWLQWIFLPRMQMLLDTDQVLPVNFSLFPYFYAVLDNDKAGKLLDIIKQLDDLSQSKSK